jgi:hypothetical protein
MPDSNQKIREGKFIPNMSQLKEAVEQLPDPEEWSEMTYTSAVLSNGLEKPVRFKKGTVSRGSKKTYRWIYEGKVLIRKRDALQD